MGQPSRRKHFHRGDCRGTKGNKARAHTRDLDQIYEDLKPQDARKPKAALPINHDLPGLGQHYCVECAKFYVDMFTLNAHQRSKAHKQRVRELKTVPFTQKEADAAAGMGSYVAPKPRAVSDKPVEAEMEIMSIVETEA
ncbi:putative Zinc finger protein 593 [Hypsibius exemplaris]|uniref:Zinc finger protein 593 homolog n=1 Tax=Hypsibius exemplaris TaxID=2072580 RepID=A0A1W0WNC1_HYPEX|nr:putative Zinc finger protein 593 [Hypsibius exemplaris]